MDLGTKDFVGNNNTYCSEEAMLGTSVNKREELPLGASTGEPRNVSKDEDNVKCHLCSAVLISRQQLLDHVCDFSAPKPSVPMITSDECSLLSKTKSQNCDKHSFRKQPKHQIRKTVYPMMGHFKLQKHAEKRRKLANIMQRIANNKRTPPPSQLSESETSNSAECGATDSSPEQGKDSVSAVGHNSLGASSKTPTMSFPCPCCSDSFNRSCDLKRHMLKHSDDRPFQCPTCPAAYSRAGDLKRHRLTHSGEKPFKCTACDKAFIRAYDLERHIMRIHVLEKYFKCDECGSAYTRENDLKRHKVISHASEEELSERTKDKPYQCSICLASYFHVSLLARHMASHDADQQE